MSDNLPVKVQAVLNLIKASSTASGLLNNLSTLIETIKKDKKLSKTYRYLEEQSKKELDALKKREKIVIKWLNDCLERLKKSENAAHPMVFSIIQRAENVIKFKKYEVQGIVLSELGQKLLGSFEREYNPLDRTWTYVDAALDALCNAASALAAFGYDPLFAGWAEVKNLIQYAPKEVLKYLPTLDENFKGEVPMGPIKKKIIKLLNRGVDCWIVEPMDKEIENYRPVYIRYGAFYGLIYPKELNDLYQFRNQKGKNEWIELCQCDPVINFKITNLLAEYKSFIPATLIPMNSWEEAEQFAVKADKGFFLSRFKSKEQSIHPMTLIQLQNHVSRFMAFFQMSQKEKENGSSIVNKEIAKKAAQKAARKKYEYLKKKGQVIRLQGDFTPNHKEVLDQDDRLVQADLSDTLIKKAVSQVAKEEKFTATRGKDKKPRHTI